MVTGGIKILDYIAQRNDRTIGTFKAARLTREQQVKYFEN